ncbi:hypothetical protein SODALDRAFT_196160 [Sodiomyces alkalinus F11]|uniref:Uncharacterized protein n=1 Tax=Sodiomyces alkalinus (strain CBS 110278 / VKM F-3762 / F11) TaxID=1314773 RepID=A0A3N2PSD5_SODAK|nr:hypothetical protein SODALDRAFT_196160 [Sodiomyces alkalinus F11]ROT37415.1 hypothetical protein SODALDRAFT_196160 [Sodiomyces alkalinus F11]
MPSVAEEPRRFPAGKKRRREDDDARTLQDSVQPHEQHHDQAHQLAPRYPKLSQYHPHNDDNVSFSAIGNVQRKTLPLPSAKKLRTSDHAGVMEELHQLHQNPYTPHHNLGHDDYISRSTNHIRSPQSVRSPSTSTRPPPARVNSGALLEPCHICRRKPTKKSDLDSYADCEGCQSRTCFICLRQCPGWTTEYLGPPRRSATQTDEADQETSDQDVLSRSFHMDDADDPPEGQEKERGGQDDGGGEKQAHKMNGQGQEKTNWWASGEHRQVICSRCCIERGKEGDIACFGCLSRICHRAVVRLHAPILSWMKNL